jgi:hypothetical protein
VARVIVEVIPTGRLFVARDEVVATWATEGRRFRAHFNRVGERGVVHTETVEERPAGDAAVEAGLGDLPEMIPRQIGLRGLEIQPAEDPDDPDEDDREEPPAPEAE